MLTITSPVVSLTINAGSTVRIINWLDILAHEGFSFLGCFMPRNIDTALIRAIFRDECHVSFVYHDETVQIRLRPRSDFKPAMSVEYYRAVYNTHFAPPTPLAA